MVVPLSPLVTVITPYRDAERFLPALAATLQGQTFPNWECLLVDHCSSDAGPTVAAELAEKDSRFRCLEEHDPRGLPALPRNRALPEARGKLVCFLDVDDLWHPEKLERQVAFHEQNDLELSVTAYGRFSCSINSSDLYTSELPMRWRRLCPPGSLKPRQLRFGNPIPMLTVMINRDVLRLAPLAKGPFEALHHEDHLLWIRLSICRSNIRYGCLGEVLAFHRRYQENLTARNLRMVKWIYSVHRASGCKPFAAAAMTCIQLIIRLLQGLHVRIVPQTGAAIGE